MEIPVFVEPTADGFRATGLALADLSAEGRTEAEALAGVRAKIAARAAAGARLVHLHVDEVQLATIANAAAAAARMAANPFIDEWVRATAEGRRLMEAEEEARERAEVPRNGHSPAAARADEAVGP